MCILKNVKHASQYRQIAVFSVAWTALIENTFGN